MNFCITLFPTAHNWSYVFQGSHSIKWFFIFKLQLEEEWCHKPSATLNSCLIFSYKAILTLAIYWVMLTEEGIPEVGSSAFKIIRLLKNIRWAPRKVLGVTGRKLNIEWSLSACRQPYCLGQHHWIRNSLQK